MTNNSTLPHEIEVRIRLSKKLIHHHFVKTGDILNEIQPVPILLKEMRPKAREAIVYLFENEHISFQTAQNSKNVYGKVDNLFSTGKANFCSDTIPTIEQVEALYIDYAEKVKKEIAKRDERHEEQIAAYEAMSDVQLAKILLPLDSHISDHLKPRLNALAKRKQNWEKQIALKEWEKKLSKLEQKPDSYFIKQDEDTLTKTLKMCPQEFAERKTNLLEKWNEVQEEYWNNYEQEKANWIKNHGSKRLRIGFEEDYEIDFLYAEERIATEYPGFQAFLLRNYRYWDVDNPPLHLLQLHEKYSKQDGKIYQIEFDPESYHEEAFVLRHILGNWDAYCILAKP